MDSFEQVVSEILWQEGYWVRTSDKVELTKEEKREINLPSSPRWEIDVVAYKAQNNALLAVECKSYLDNPGVRFNGFDGSNEKERTVSSYSINRSFGMLFFDGCDFKWRHWAPAKPTRP